MTQAPNSSVAGFLAPAASPAPLEGEALDDFLQQFVVGVTGLDGTLVRPRWQAEPPDLPAKTKTWVAIGVTRRPAPFLSIERHNADGSSTTITQEELVTLLSFYGPAAGVTLSRFRSGVSVAQNREYLTLANFGFVSLGEPTNVPELIKSQWVNRIDVELTLSRGVDYTYPVENINAFQGDLLTDVPPGIYPINVTQPPQ